MGKNAIGGGRPIVTKADLRPIEKRVLDYLDQHGATYRQKLVADLASPESRIGQGISNGSNAFMPAIAARWVKRLKNGGFVVDVRDHKYYHQHFTITPAGRKLIRSA